MSEKIVQFPGIHRSEVEQNANEINVANFHALKDFLAAHPPLPADVARLQAQSLSAEYLIRTLNNSTPEAWKENPALYQMFVDAIEKRIPNNPDD